MDLVGVAIVEAAEGVRGTSKIGGRLVSICWRACRVWFGAAANSAPWSASEFGCSFLQLLPGDALEVHAAVKVVVAWFRSS